MRKLVSLALVTAALAASAYAATPLFRKSQQLRIDAMNAEAAGDLAAAEAALSQALELRPGHPGILLSLASVEARIGHLDSGALHVGQYVSMGLVANLKGNPDFEPLKYKPHFIGALLRMGKNALPVGEPQVAYRLGDGRALFESIAVESKGRAFAGSVRQRRIVVIENGTARDFATANEGLWSVYGIAVDEARGLLWAASAAGPQSEGVPASEHGATGLFAFDLATGALKRKAALPAAEKISLGDLVVAPDGTVYASDSGENGIYRLAPGATALEPFVTDQRFVSLQGLTLSPDGTKMLAADYALGPFVIDMERRDVTRVSVPSGVTLIGIDALTGPNPFLATQNGVNPQRVLRLTLDEDWMRVIDVTVMAANSPLHDEITLGQIVGDEFVYVANSQWNRFNPDGSILSPEKPFAEAVAVKIRLR